MKKSDVGIFLHRTPYSESSLITTFYTKNSGLQTFIYQGVRKKNNALFPLNICELSYYKHPHSELAKLVNTSSVSSLTTIISNPLKSSIAFFIVDVLKQTLQTNQTEKLLFKFLEEEIINLNYSKSVGSFPVNFLAKYTKFLGISPAITKERPAFFNLREGEFYYDKRNGETEIDGVICQQLFELFEGREVGKEHRKEVLNTLLHYYELHSPRFNVTKSLEIISMLLHD